MFNYYLVTLFKNGCGDYGCSGTKVKKVVAAEGEDQAAEKVYDEDDLSIELRNVEKFNLPDLDNITDPFVLV